LQIARNSNDPVSKIDELLNVIKVEFKAWEVSEASEMTKTRRVPKGFRAPGLRA